MSMKNNPKKVHALLYSADLLERHLETLLSSLGVRPKQARVLNVLDRIGAVSQALLAREMGVTPGSMSTMVTRLQAAGLIHRHGNARDRRADVLSLTRNGRRLLVEIHDVWRDMDEMIAAALGPARAALLAELATELKVHLGGRVAGKGWPHRSPEDPDLPTDVEEDYEDVR